MPFAIDDLTSVIAHWSADAIVGLSDGDPVDALPDSISSWDLAGTTTTRPLYRPTSAINSLPAVEFDGVDDYLAGAVKSLTITNVGLAIVANITLKNYGALLFLSTASGTPSWYSTTSRLSSLSWLSSNQCAIGSSNGTGVGYALAQQCLSTGVSSLISGVRGDVIDFIRVSGGRTRFGDYNSTYRRAYDDGEPQGPGLSSTSVYSSLGRLNIAGSFLDGLVSEIILWDESIDNESLYIEGVLAHKYGITLPTTHPFYAAAPTSGPPTGAGGGLMKIGQGGGYNA